jgi:hypothetical protein
MPTYYFDPVNGLDANDGLSVGAPKQNASSVTFAANDVVLLHAGKRWVAPAGTQAINLPQSGIRVGAYGAGDTPPIIDGAQVSRGINIGTDRADWIIEDVWIDNVAAGTNRRGITNITTGSSETVPVLGKIRRVKVTNVPTDGANDCNGIMLWGQGVEILDTVIEDIATDGIWLRCRNASVGRAQIRRVAQDDDVRGDFGDCIQFGGAGASDFSNARVFDCLLDHSSSQNAKNSLILNAATATNGVMIEGNTVITSTVTQQIGIFVEANNATVRGNRVIGGDYGVLFGGTTSGSVAYGNDVTGANFGIRLGSNVTGTKIVNNTLRRNGVGFYGSRNDNTTEIYYNLIYDNIVGIQRHGNMLEDYNWLFNETNFGSLGGGGSIGANSTLTDPRPYLNRDGSLKTEGYSRANPNPLATIGAYRQGVRLINGRMRPGWCPVGAYQAVLPRQART